MDNTERKLMDNRKELGTLGQLFSHIEIIELKEWKLVQLSISESKTKQIQYYSSVTFV